MHEEDDDHNINVSPNFMFKNKLKDVKCELETPSYFWEIII